MPHTVGRTCHSKLLKQTTRKTKRARSTQRVGPARQTSRTTTRESDPTRTTQRVAPTQDANSHGAVRTIAQSKQSVCPHTHTPAHGTTAGGPNGANEVQTSLAQAGLVPPCIVPDRRPAIRGHSVAGLKGCRAARLGSNCKLLRNMSGGRGKLSVKQKTVVA